MRTERQYRNSLRTKPDHMHLLSVIPEMRHARRGEGCSPSFTDGTGLLTARIRCKFITVDILHMIPQFVNSAQRFGSFLIGLKHVTDAEEALDRLIFFGNRLYF
jgi:hypothetical protein